MSKADERLARTEATYRAGNEILEGRVEASSAEVQTFLCECSDESCKENVHLTQDEYDHVRSHPAHFALVNGHQGREELVVESFDRFTLVEKIGVARAVVEEMNPR